MTMSNALSIAAVLLAIAGIVTILSGSFLAGFGLILVALIVGPGGYSITRNR